MNIITVDTINYDHDKIKTKKYISPQSGLNYTIISSKIETDKDGEILENPYPEYRSIVTTENPTELLCFAQPSPIKYDTFIEFYNGLTDKNNEIIINELVEGTLICLYYDKRNSSWEISTRSSVECNYWFVRTEYGNTNPSQKTFREMFYDAIGTNDLNYHFEMYNTNYCYSFILQHPDNHIVLPILEPALYLVTVYEIFPAGAEEAEENDTENGVLRQYPFVRFIPIYRFSDENADPPHPNNPLEFIYVHMQNYNTVLLPQIVPYYEMYDGIEDVSNYYPMGIMITHTLTGKQTQIVNKNYEWVRKVRGNNPNLQYHFFEVLRDGKLAEFLQYFPNYIDLFSRFHHQFQDFISQVHQAYFTYYVKKNREKNIPKRIFIHAARIHHEIYIPEHRLIKRPVVAEYFQRMSPSQLVYYMGNNIEDDVQKPEDLGEENVVGALA